MGLQFANAMTPRVGTGELQKVCDGGETVKDSNACRESGVHHE